MARVKKIVLAVVVLILLSQIPFAYRRYRLGRLHAAIQSLQSNSRKSQTQSAEDLKSIDSDDTFYDYKGVVHVHSFLGGHSTGTFQEILSAAESNHLQFVVMTEHVEGEFDTSVMTLKGEHAKVLFVNGNEVSASDGERLLSLPGDISLTGSSKLPATEIVANSRARSAFSIAAYPQEMKNADAGADGLEVYNVFTNARTINPIVAFFDGLWSHRTYPDLVFANYLQRPAEALNIWDAMLARRKVVATAGNDAHSNVGISLNDASGNEIVGLKLDPYRVSFALVRLHVLIPGVPVDSMLERQRLDERLLLDALAAGHCFIGFDFLGDPGTFRFEAISGQHRKIQGDEIVLQSDTHLRIVLPVSSRLMIFHDGNVWLDENGVTNKDISVSERGVYRVEVYLPQLGKPVGDKPWIISNPIYVK